MNRRMTHLSFLFEIGRKLTIRLLRALINTPAEFTKNEMIGSLVFVTIELQHFQVYKRLIANVDGLSNKDLFFQIEIGRTPIT